jgi:hypothetical protein
MNTNSFLIKGWMITLVSAMFALAAKDSDVRYLSMTYISIPVFWMLDAFYLSQERQYRDLYRRVAANEAVDFSMDASVYNSGRNTWLASLCSRTVVLLYPVVAAIVVSLKFWHR